MCIFESSFPQFLGGNPFFGNMDARLGNSGMTEKELYPGVNIRELQL
jgi:hypothetical protein